MCSWRLISFYPSPQGRSNKCFASHLHLNPFYTRFSNRLCSLSMSHLHEHTRRHRKRHPGLLNPLKDHVSRSYVRHCRLHVRESRYIWQSRFQVSRITTVTSEDGVKTRCIRVRACAWVCAWLYKISNISQLCMGSNHSLLSYRISEFLILSGVVWTLMVGWAVYLWVLFTLGNCAKAPFLDDNRNIKI